MSEEKQKEIVIKFENISKSYYSGIKAFNLREVFARLLQPKDLNRPEIKSLDDVSFEVYKGETVGIIGQNGSGKSTALKIIAGISAPTAGKLTLKGKITSMLALGAGLHPDFTGRENIFLNGSLFGMSNYYLSSKVAEIIDFSELGEKIDQPLRTYSSGMMARLSFSVAIQTQPEILLIDEVLAVGDIAFQEKCLQKFEEIKSQKNTTIVMVTHSLEQAEEHCSKVIWIQNSKLMGIGSPKKIVEEYTKAMMSH